MMPPAQKPNTLKSIKVLPNQRQLACLRFSRCGKVLAGGTLDGAVHRWDASGDAFAELPPLRSHHGFVQSITFHPDGKRLFATDSWGRLSCWPYQDKDAKPLWSVPNAHDGWIHQMALSPDGGLLATAGRDHMLRLFSSADGSQNRILDAGDDLFSVAFHPEGRHVISGDLHGVIRAWDLRTGASIRTFDAKAMHLKDRIQDVGGVRGLTFDDQGSMLIAGGAKPKTGGFVTGTPLILFFDWHTSKVKHTIQGASDTEVYVLDMLWNPAGYLMAVSSGQPGTGKLIFQRPTEPQPFLSVTNMANCHALALDPVGKRLAVSGSNANSAGNGRPKGDAYPGNYSPVHVFEMPAV